MEVINYNSANDIIVKFINKDEIHTTFQHFKKGDVTSLYDKTICGLGYLGEGKHCNHGIIYSKQQYKIWKGLIERCYKHYHEDRNYVYNECIVSEEWYNFQNFADWYDENYYEIDGQKMHLDKDILVKGNKIYSPETCCFVPQNINKLFTKSGRIRGIYPIGVYWDTRDEYFVAQCNNGYKKQVVIGYYKTEIEAFNAYRIYKEQLIKNIADEYKDYLPSNIYKAMYEYIVEISD